MRGDKNKIFFAILMIFVILNFQLVTWGAEVEVKKKAELKETETEEVEEDTMLNIMPSLKIPKRILTEYSILQQFEYLDNYYLGKDNKKGRFASISSPAVSIKYPIGRSYLKGEYAYGFSYYIGKNEQVHRHNASIKAYHRPTRRFSLGLTETFLRNDQPDQERDIDVKIAGKTFNKNILQAQAKYEINKRLRCGIDGNYSFLNFDERPTGVLTDHTDFGYGGDVEYIIDPRAALGIVYNLYKTSFEKSDEKDSNKHILHLRYSRKMQKAFTLEARGGYSFVNYGSGKDIIGASASTSLNFDVSRFTKSAFGYDYSFKDSLREDYLAFRSHSFHVSLEHNLTPRLKVDMNSSYDIQLYDSSYDISGSGITTNKENSVIGFACSLNYKLTKKIDIGAGYNTSVRFSDFTDDEYFSNHYLLSIRGIF